jgi:DNA-binding XRE family transcriptional regulator
MPAGRPTDYRPEYAEQAEKLSLMGATDMQMADFFDVSEQTFNAWKHRHPKFLESIKVAKEVADKNVERSLYRKAMGYEFESEKVFCNDGSVTRVPIREIVPPSDTACIFWLKNRKSAEWRDRHEHTGKDGGPIQFVTKSILEE